MNKNHSSCQEWEQFQTTWKRQLIEAKKRWQMLQVSDKVSKAAMIKVF